MHFGGKKSFWNAPALEKGLHLYRTEFSIFFTTPVIFISVRYCVVLWHKRVFRATVVQGDCSKIRWSPSWDLLNQNLCVKDQGSLHCRITPLGCVWAPDPAGYSQTPTVFQFLRLPFVIFLTLQVDSYDVSLPTNAAWIFLTSSHQGSGFQTLSFKL